MCLLTGRPLTRVPAAVFTAHVAKLKGLVVVLIQTLEINGNPLVGITHNFVTPHV